MANMTPEQAAFALLTAAQNMGDVLSGTMGEAAALVRDTAKAKIGVQQPDWAPLAQSTEDRKAQGGYPTGAPLLREGDLKESIFAYTEGLDGYVGSNDEAAAAQEYGTPTIPPRPFISTSIYENTDAITDLIGANVVKKLS